MVKNIKAKLGVAFAALALLLSLTAFAMLDRSFAWFVAHKEVTGQGITVTVHNSKIDATMVSLGVLSIEDGLYTYENQTDANGVQKQRFELPEDDPNGISYSEYSRALVLQFDFDLEEAADVTVTVQAKNGEVSVAKQNFFSNCVIFTDATHDAGGNVVEKGSSTKAFVTVSNGVATKQSTLTLFEGHLAEGVTSLYFIMEYNDAFIDYINDYIANNSPGYSEVFYNNDILITVE